MAYKRAKATVTSVSMAMAEVVEAKGGGGYLVHDAVQIEADTPDGRVQVRWEEEWTDLQVGDQVAVAIEWEKG